jgi:hypothetical protein
MKRVVFGAIVGLLFSITLFPVEAGVFVGTVTNPSHMTYGLSGGMGFLLPLVKFEFELCRQSGTEDDEKPNTLSAGIKFRPKFGKFWPYAVVGVGTEFRRFSLDFNKFDTFTFIGGGIHYKLLAVLSLRADLRFLNYSEFNRTRLSAGLFVHF